MQQKFKTLRILVADFLLNLLGVISIIFLSYLGGELVGKLKLPNVLEWGFQKAGEMNRAGSTKMPSQEG
jgi:hypothetical protein